jgi:hypothetical protein
MKPLPSQLRLPDAIGLAYLAGIVDGEGSIRSGGYNTKTDWQITVSNTDPNLMEWLKTIGGRVYVPSMASNQLGHKQCFTWSVHRSNEVVALLMALLPYLIIKREPARRALSAMRLWLARPMGMKRRDTKPTQLALRMISKVPDLRLTCIHGHIWTDATTYRWRGKRYCRTCKQDREVQAE